METAQRTEKGEVTDRSVRKYRSRAMTWPTVAQSIQIDFNALLDERNKILKKIMFGEPGDNIMHEKYQMRTSPLTQAAEQINNN